MSVVRTMEYILFTYRAGSYTGAGVGYSIFTSSFSAEIIIVELQYAWTVFSVFFAELCETNMLQ